MKRKYLGEFEELVMLVAASLKDAGPYAVSIKQELDKHSSRKTNISAIHTTLYRLEAKGLMKSRSGGATKERGGRSKRFFFLTAEGKKALYAVQSLRHSLWNKSPELALELIK